jgi:L-fuconolactonase
MTIDAHHHFWTYDTVDYDWIDDSMNAIRRDFGPEHLKDEIRQAGVDAVISVQARQTLGETTWLLENARENDFIKGVVGWVPLVSPTVTEDLDRLMTEPKLCGVRHVLQGEPDGFMLRDDFNAGIHALRSRDLIYDILVFEHQLSETMKFVDRHPAQVFVLDHIAKPRVKAALLEPWKANLHELAKRENVFCKLSGVVTEANWTDWSVEQLRPYVETVIEAFGPSRLMFGSDWPVCLLATGYRQWVDTVRNLTRELSPAEQSQIFGETAQKAYRLS